MMAQHAAMWAGLMACLVPLAGRADRIGDPGPPLHIKEWIKGKPVEVKAGTNTFVIAFWAALSPASRASLPKLGEVQKKFQDKGVIVLGVSDEPPDKIKEFLARPEASVGFTVAADDQRKTAHAYMVAYGQNGIPYAFIVGKEGKVLWHGYPMQGLEKALEDIVAGQYDLAQAIKRDATRAELDEYRMLARKGDPKAKDLGQKLLAARTNNVVQLCDFAYRIAADVQNTNRDFVLAGEALDKAEKLASTNTAPVVLTRAVILFEQGKREEGLALGKKAADLAKTPKEKAAVEMRLRVMEGRHEAETRRKGLDPRPSRPQ